MGATVEGAGTDGGALSVCIVTHEFPGLPGSGGIGTAFAGLTEALSRRGASVTVLVSGLLPVPPGFETPEDHDGIRRVRLPDAPAAVHADPFLRLSYAVFAWLRDRRFDVVHFADWTGLGFCATAAKRQGLAFADTTLTVGLHGPTRWVRSITGGAFESPDELAADFLERCSAEQADAVVSPSRFMLDWVRATGWVLPADALAIPNLLPGGSPERPAGTHAVTELVFFGRLETRKGVALFCDALDRLASTAPAGLRVTFLGGSAPVDGEDGAAYVRRRAASWPWKVELIGNRGSREALDYLRGDGRLAVIPSLIENLPCTVAECLVLGLPFIATDVGGTPELVAEADAGRTLVPPDAGRLAERLAGALHDGMQPAQPRHPQCATADIWSRWHEERWGRSAPLVAAVAPDAYVLLAAPELRLDDAAATVLAEAAGRMGAAAAIGVLDAAGELWPAHGGPLALAPLRDVFGPGPVVVRRDRLGAAPPPTDAAGRQALLMRLLGDGERVVPVPLVLATAAERPMLPDRALRLAAFRAGAPAPLDDLARLSTGLAAQAERLQAAQQAASARHDGDLATLRTERDQLARELEQDADDAERRAAFWRNRLDGVLESHSWRLSAPLRRALGGTDATALASLPPELAVDTVMGSVWWDVAAPLRVAARLAKRMRRLLP
ncbi:glycosyltransferase [Azospirillum sp. sgz301742]